MTDPIYLDHHATTPCDPAVVEAMVPWLSERFGNAASVQYRLGQEANRAVEQARVDVAGLLGASPKDVVFTSGATESLNLALKGLVEAAKPGRDHLVTTAIEHPAVLDTCEVLARRGVEVTVVPVGADGLVDPETIREAVGERTLAVAVMAANNEVGTVQPLAAIGAICGEAGVHLVTDAAQAAGKVPLDVDAMGIDLLALSGHKLYGPKGVGALYVRSRGPRVRLAAQTHGGGQEKGLRSGTLNVPGIVGLGTACAVAGERMERDAEHTRALRDRLLERLRAEIPDLHVHGSLAERLPHNLNVAFPGVQSAELLRALPDVALSAGSACTTTVRNPSHVLKALGVPDGLVFSSVRFGLGRYTTAEEIERAATRVIEEVRRLRR